VVAERPLDEKAVGRGPAEGAEPVRRERRRPLAVVVVAEGDKGVDLPRPRREPLDGRACEALALAADAEVADREDARVGVRRGRGEQGGRCNGGCEKESDL
jgi:hypothetical protein